MSEEVKQNERRENQGGMNTEGGDPQRDQNSRNGYRNSRRRHSSRPIGRDQRTNTIEIQPKGAERPVNPNNPAPGNRNNPRRENQPQQRRNNFPQDQRPSGGAPDRGPKPAGAREHIVKEIRPDDRQNQNTQQNRNNRQPQNPANQNNRNREYEKPVESKTWSRSLRSEETSEDIRQENERIEKEIALEISGIHTMKLD